MLPDPVATLVLFNLHLNIPFRSTATADPLTGRQKFDDSDRLEALVTLTLVTPEIVEKPTCQRQ